MSARPTSITPGVCLAAALATLAACSIARRPSLQLHYPPAPRGTVVDVYHGVAVADPYRWLEQLDSAQTRGWVTAEAHLTDGYFASLAQRPRLRARLAALYDFERTGVPLRENGRYFYSSNSGHQQQSVLLMTTGAGGVPAVAVDPNVLARADHPIVSGYVPSHDGALMAYGVSLSGSDWTEWHVRDLATGNDLPDVLRFTKYYHPVWRGDDQGLYYSAFPAPRAGTELSSPDLGNALYYHALGTPAAADRRVLGDWAHPDRQYQPFITDDGRWLIIATGEGEVGDKGRENLYLLDLRTPQAVPVAIASGFEAAYVYAGADAGWLYFLTTLDAPRGRVIAIDPAAPAREHWRRVIPEGPDAIDLAGGRSVTLVGHRLIVRTLHDAHHRVMTYDLAGTPLREVPLPGHGTVVGFDGHPDDRDTFYAYADLVTPPTIYRYDLDSGVSRVFRAPRPTFDRAAFEQRQVFYRSADGTRIPMLLAYRKGLRFSGDAPVLLYGYGGFGQSILPAFDPSRIAWLEMDGVFAVASIRGGGEYGESWHRQAIGTHKQVVFDDFVAAARWLIAHRYTSARRLAIRGRSNGGLLVGACLTQHPELFGAAVAQVGVLDMLRFNRFGQGAGWEGDYGSPQDPRQFRALYAYSPVHNVRPGVRYPATLVITGDHDTRVMPMHSYKFAAALQAAQAGPAPILLAVDRSSGHGGGETVAQEIELSADVYAFLTENLGIDLR